MTHLIKYNSFNHGLSKTKIYKRWHAIIRRCYKESEHNYKYYGGKGIRVCEEWHNPKNFYNWTVLNKYTGKMQIDRIDSNGDYCPENCRVVTSSENIRNSGITKYSWVIVDAARDIYRKEKISTRKLAKLLGVSPSNMWSILNNKTWLYIPNDSI